MNFHRYQIELMLLKRNVEISMDLYYNSNKIN